MSYFVETSKKFEKIYDSLLIKNPKHLKLISSELALKILNELAKKPQCAMDLARKLKEHEQKIYYHLRNLEKLKLVKVLKKEERVGAIAKIYTATFPVISFKLFDGSKLINKKLNYKQIDFLHSFIGEGNFDALIIVSSPDPHGKYGAQSSDGYVGTDLGLFLGSLINEIKLPNYKLDTQVRESDLKRNLILIGGPKANIIVDKINRKLPIYFDRKDEWKIVSKISKKVYTEDDVGIFVKMKNPFNPRKEVMVMAGKRFKGTRAAVMALIKHIPELEKGNTYNPSIIAKVVRGIDRDADGIIDDCVFLE